MARRGGYGRDVEGIEWAKMSAHQDAEAKLSAAAMGQSYYTWLNDAVAFHVYYCERYRLNQQYQHDQGKPPDPIHSRLILTTRSIRRSAPGR